MALVTLDIEPVGPVLFAKSKRAKRVSITIKPFKPVRVAVPHRMSMKDAKGFLKLNLDWVTKNVANVRKIEQQHLSTVNDGSGICKKQARELLVSRLDQLARMHKFSYNRVFIRNQKTRWGSCSSLNNINLNMKLAGLKEELMDYVILHELVHTRIKNHSREFWRELDKYVGNAKTLDKELKKHVLGWP